MSQSALPRGEPGRRQRLSEVLMAIALATDLGTNQPLNHTLRACYLGVGLARDLGCEDAEVRTVFQVTLLRLLGCTADAFEMAALVGGDDRAFNFAMHLPIMGSNREMLVGLAGALGPGHSRVARARMFVRALAGPGGPDVSIASHCEVAAMLAQRLDLAGEVIHALRHGFERWDGKGYPSGLRGDEIPIAVRIAIVASAADMLTRQGDAAQPVLTQRAGHAYDPEVVDAFLGNGDAHLAAFDAGDGWDDVLDLEPEPVATIPDARLDRTLSVFADFADLKSPWTRGHSTSVAELAERAGQGLGLDAGGCRTLYRAGLVHDLGRVGVENGIWDKPARLSAEEWERVRLHPYYTQRILTRCGMLRALAELAASHHERLDGSGYHRGCGVDQLPMPARVLAASDVLVATCEERPHRPGMPLEQASQALQEEARAGRLDAEAVDAVLAAAGMEAPDTPRVVPAGLTDREVEVLRLIARGRTNRQAADYLSISPKTVGRHVENIYRKIDVSTRAGATLFAMEQRLLD